MSISHWKSVVFLTSAFTTLIVFFRICDLMLSQNNLNVAVVFIDASIGCLDEPCCLSLGPLCCWHSSKENGRQISSRVHECA